MRADVGELAHVHLQLVSHAGRRRSEAAAALARVTGLGENESPTGFERCLDWEDERKMQCYSFCLRIMGASKRLDPLAILFREKRVRNDREHRYLVQNQ